MKRGLLITLAGILAALSLPAAETNLNVYTSDREVKSFALNCLDSISIDEPDGTLTVYLKDGTRNTIVLAEVDSMNYSSGEYTLPSVETVSAEFDHELGKGICAADVSSDGGCEILERGICWSTGHNPTTTDNKISMGTTTGKFYAAMTGLGQGTVYYVRAYASNCLGTAYGEALKVSNVTGNVTYTLAVDENLYPEYHRLLKIAFDSACYYYNRYTAFQANIYVYYNPGIPTAQANYHGSIGFGPNTGYMWVGTVMHEMAHYFGSGTTSVWKNLMVGGVWQGSAAQALCQDLAGTTLKGDNNDNPIHFWPYGINYRSEVSSATDLINHARIVQAMLVEDCGLPTSW